MIRWIVGLGLVTAFVAATIGLSARQDSDSTRSGQSLGLTRTTQAPVRLEAAGGTLKLAQQPVVIKTPTEMPSIPKAMTAPQLGPSGDDLAKLSLADLRHVIQQNGTGKLFRF